MQGKYNEILRHIPLLEDHGHLYMYYGDPYNDDCLVYDDDKDGKNLILSKECDALCWAVVDAFEVDYKKWLEHLDNHEITLDGVFEVDVEKQGFDVIASLLIYLVISITYQDRFIDALHNGYLVQLLKRLEHWN